MKYVKEKSKRAKYPEERGEPGARKKRLRRLDIIGDFIEFLGWVVAFVVLMG